MRIRTCLFISLLLWGTAFAQSSNYRTLNQNRPGQVLQVTDYLVKGKLNVIEFTSTVCPASRALAPKIEALARKDQGLVVNRVLIDRNDRQASPSANGAAAIDWQSPLARQYELRSVPYFRIYDSSGQLLAEGEAARKQIAKMLIDSDTL